MKKVNPSGSKCNQVNPNEESAPKWKQMHSSEAEWNVYYCNHLNIENVPIEILQLWKEIQKVY
jgi:hypothetical protein